MQECFKSVWSCGAHLGASLGLVGLTFGCGGVNVLMQGLSKIGAHVFFFECAEGTVQP